ncbi:short-subunit dehydrogenase [Mesorhizobium sp. J18]|uniref:SDR family NAD(P)-dependent oxidoreductase n=1 Tax=Mesorhizobium sp. J18 TaxID=935263 RepID=UPI00119B46EA|nr:SDR family NAD(P)-dependent oxidoreductase [Mesorhizobium sp. J18]TWG95502.1 short-subunit dehydrogenase [Mesorhizobium sp. J18]
MPLYRASPKDGVAWVTGASTGIGKAVALDLARAGYTVAATARDQADLKLIEQEAMGLPGRILAFPCDVSDEKGMERTVAAIEKEAGPIVLALLNAGTYLPIRGDRMETTNFVRSFEINVLGVIFGLVPVVDRMRERGFGQVAVTGSVTSYFGLPSAAAYGATKAALNNLVESLRFDLEKMNIRLQVFNPGFIATPLTEKAKFPMPALMKVEDASRRILKAFQSGGFEVTFPRRLTWSLKFLRLVPQPIRFWLLYKITGWDKRPIGPRDRRRS